MQLVSVNVGQLRSIQNAKASGQTGIYKLPTLDRVKVSAEGLRGDVICDVKNHGGPDQAVYIYSTTDYDWWSNELGVELAPGAFGENLTVSDFESARASIGDRLVLNEVTLEITDPRLPCVTLARRMSDPDFMKRFRSAERPGVYCRVIRAGFVQVGETVTLEKFSGEAIPIVESFREGFTPNRSEASLRRYLAAPISIRNRLDKEAMLREVLAGS